MCRLDKSMDLSCSLKSLVAPSFVVVVAPKIPDHPLRDLQENDWRDLRSFQFNVRMCLSALPPFLCVVVINHFSMCSRD